MANYYAASDQHIDMGFRALADGTRRAVIMRLSEGDMTVSDLAAPFDMALPTFMKHLKVLEEGGLITTEKVGRVRTCRLDVERLARLNRWISTYEAGWRRRLDHLDAALNNLENKT